MFKQHFANEGPQTWLMDVSPANRTLAENLRYYMEKAGLKQQGLAAKSGVKQTTISLYLRPEARIPGKDGKAGSAKLTEVEQLADAFGIAVWELLRPYSPGEREAYAQIEAAFKALHQQTPAAPASGPAQPEPGPAPAKRTRKAPSTEQEQA